MVFGLLRPSISISAREKAWVELQFQWFWETLGSAAILQQEVLTPTEARELLEVAGQPYVERCFEFICRRLNLNPESIELQITENLHDREVVSWHAEDGRSVLKVTDQRLTTNLCVALMARELAKAALAKGAESTIDDVGHVLAPSFVGLGIFNANSTIVEWTETDTGPEAGMSARQLVARFGTLTSSTLGYACALHAWVRGDAGHGVKGWLRADAASSYAKGLRYLAKTRDSLFQPSGRDVFGGMSAAMLGKRLVGASPSHQIGLMWKMLQQSDRTSIVADVLPLMRSRHAEVRAAAAKTLGRVAERDPTIGSEVRRLAKESNWLVRFAAAIAIGSLKADDEESLEVLADLISDDDEHVATAAGVALIQFGSTAQPYERDIIAGIRKAIIDYRMNLASSLIGVTAMYAENTPAYLLEHFNSDLELRDLVMQVYDQEARTLTLDDWRAASASALQRESCPLAW